jgi:hypothetical protein
VWGKGGGKGFGRQTSKQKNKKKTHKNKQTNKHYKISPTKSFISQPGEFLTALARHGEPFVTHTHRQLHDDVIDDVADDFLLLS